MVSIPLRVFYTHKVDRNIVTDGESGTEMAITEGGPGGSLDLKKNFFNHYPYLTSDVNVKCFI